MPPSEEQLWMSYREKELRRATPLLSRLGFELEEKQPHIQGERFLMQALTTTSGKKLILLGRRSADQKRVVIKVSSDRDGQAEIAHERTCRNVLREIKFAYQTFFSPPEILYTTTGGMVIFVQEFIEQECSFLERPFADQFFLALRAFKAQESAHATTYRHLKQVRKSFGSAEAKDYLRMFWTFAEGIASLPKARECLESAGALLLSNTGTIEQYSGFLTHVDFVPHNFRILHDTIYLLDHSSIRFGNKYEGWARFINFMTLYHPALSEALIQYVRDNRTSEETQALWLMRLYRLGEIIFYYKRTLGRSTGNLLLLNEKRIELWTEILAHTLKKESPPETLLTHYKQEREHLRSEDEKDRQKELH